MFLHCLLLTGVSLAQPIHISPTSKYDLDARAALALASASQTSASAQTPQKALPCGKTYCDCGCAEGGVCVCASKVSNNGSCCGKVIKGVYREGARSGEWIWTNAGGGYWWRWSR